MLGAFWEHMPAIDPNLIRDRMLFLQNEIRRPFDKGFFDALYSLSSFYWEDVAPFSAPTFPPSFYFVICTGKSRWPCRSCCIAHLTSFHQFLSLSMASSI
ncbi:hypothetical protein CsSME_00045553 [Camellia sinensis var. sinensis]